VNITPIEGYDCEDDPNLLTGRPPWRSDRINLCRPANKLHVRKTDDLGPSQLNATSDLRYALSTHRGARGPMGVVDLAFKRFGSGELPHPGFVGSTLHAVTGCVEAS
jgi:hypothetical protein